MTVELCSIPECFKEKDSRGWCNTHYQRWRKYGDPLKTVKSKTRYICEITDCENKHLAKGYCSKHYDKFKKYGDPLAKAAARAKPYIDGNGYRRLPGHRGHPNARDKDGYIFEHVLTMSTTLGRPLLPNENVHHKNGDRLDNRISNLELWSRAQPSGQRVEDKLKWAVEIINQYGNEHPEILEGLLN